MKTWILSGSYFFACSKVSLCILSLHFNDFDVLAKNNQCLCTNFDIQPKLRMIFNKWLLTDIFCHYLFCTCLQYFWIGELSECLYIWIFVSTLFKPCILTTTNSFTYHYKNLFCFRFFKWMGVEKGGNRSNWSSLRTLETVYSSLYRKKAQQILKNPEKVEIDRVPLQRWRVIQYQDDCNLHVWIEKKYLFYLWLCI